MLSTTLRTELLICSAELAIVWALCALVSVATDMARMAVTICSTESVRLTALAATCSLEAAISLIEAASSSLEVATDSA